MDEKPTKNPIRPRKLTLKQDKACLAYMETGNKTEAYRRAFCCEKMKEATVNNKAYQFFNRDDIRARCDELKAPVIQASQITAGKVLAEIAKLSFSDVRNIFDKKGQLLPVHLLPDDVAASIASIKVTTKRVPGGKPGDVEYITEVKCWDKRGSLELLGKHLKLFNELGSKENPFTTDKLSDEQLDQKLQRMIDAAVKGE
jgi:phage terminase small subunit